MDYNTPATLLCRKMSPNQAVWRTRWILSESVFLSSYNSYFSLRLFVVIVVIYGPELKNNRKTSFFPLSRPHMNQTSAVRVPSFILSHHVQQQVDRFSVTRRHLVRLLADLQQTGRGQLRRKTRREQRVSEEQLLSFVSHVLSKFLTFQQN